MAELYDQENPPAEGPETAGKAHEEMVDDFNKPGLGEVSDLDEARKQKEAGNASPLEGGIKEYDPEKAPSERRMKDMEQVKEQNREEDGQAGFDKFAEDARQEKRQQIREEESTLMGKLRKFLGGK